VVDLALSCEHQHALESLLLSRLTNITVVGATRLLLLYYHYYSTGPTAHLNMILSPTETSSSGTLTPDSVVQPVPTASTTPWCVRPRASGNPPQSTLVMSRVACR
jgi:hypothetical protein